MKVIKHAHHGTIFRMPNEDAHLLVSSGRYVYSSKFEARQITQRQTGRSLLWRVFMFVTVLVAIVASLLLSTSARAANLAVPKLAPKQQPYQVCLTQSQAALVYKGKKLKYRMVKDEQGRHEVCWYAGAKLPKHAFINTPRSTGVAVTPARPSTQEPARVQAAPVGSIPTAGDQPINTAFTATLEDDAIRALTGRAERDFERASFDELWARSMKAAGGR